MKQNTVAIVIIALLILGGGYYLFSNNTSTSNSANSDSLPTTIYDESTTPEDDDAMDSSENDETMEAEKMGNRYVAYSPTAFEEGSEKTRVLYFFANWCPTCIPVDKELQDNASEIPEGTVVYRANYNDSETDAEEEALAKQYGITYQHTFVIVDSDGNEVNKWNGGGLDKLLSEL